MKICCLALVSYLFLGTQVQLNLPLTYLSQLLGLLWHLTTLPLLVWTAHHCTFFADAGKDSKVKQREILIGKIYFIINSIVIIKNNFIKLFNKEVN